jgi:hypothetical protein
MQSWANSLVQHPVAASMILSVPVTFYALAKASQRLSKKALNNYQEATPWKGEKELVVVTGGSSGIGKQIVEDLAAAAVRVVILDVQEPSNTLRPSIPRCIYLKSAW